MLISPSVSSYVVPGPGEQRVVEGEDGDGAVASEAHGVEQRAGQAQPVRAALVVDLARHRRSVDARLRQPAGAVEGARGDVGVPGTQPVSVRMAR